jgi:hypothetical protein
MPFARPHFGDMQKVKKRGVVVLLRVFLAEVGVFRSAARS